ncbi:hypothetical protein [Prevotella sp. OH937_COT-195]|uniref:hypothetical protein n=1 Tax=Prevotella sp. OH937_COT-195 TaxID=2491051 RepID=UPI001F2B2D7B|nr:hypothetical protein [Prevotella sp. OH937_COT-195]
MNGRTTAPKRHDKEDLGFLDDRLQLLDTVREMIDIELERRGLNADGTPPPRAHIVAAHREFLRRHPLIIR